MSHIDAYSNKVQSENSPHFDSVFVLQCIFRTTKDYFHFDDDLRELDVSFIS